MERVNLVDLARFSVEFTEHFGEFGGFGEKENRKLISEGRGESDLFLRSFSNREGNAK